MGIKRSRSTGDWLPLAKAGTSAAELPTGEAFRAEWIDFTRGIRVGNLEPHERITQILKFHLEQQYGTPFITDRWGRGVFWQWICWLPRANRAAKPLSHDVNFGCAKLFITAETDAKVFKSGLQVERGYVTGTEAQAAWGLRADFDWHRLVRQCAPGTTLDRELRRLLKREGFRAEVGGQTFAADNFVSARQVRAAMRRCPPDQWAGFQLYYPMPAAEVRGCNGIELVRAMVGVFTEVVPAMNAVMQVPLVAAGGTVTGRAPLPTRPRPR